MGKKIGIFGGSFDPIHIGHINLALSIAEIKGLDEVLFCPAKVSPFKVDTPPIASYENRCLMVEKALEGIDHFSLSRVDEKRGEPSFMIDSLIELKKEYGDDQFFLIIASDAYANFSKWKRADDIAAMALLLVGDRPGLRASTLPVSSEQYCKVAAMDISSKNLRKRLKKRVYCAHQIPAKVLDFIYQNRLYY